MTYLPYYGQATLEERILEAEVIARVRFRSVEPVGLNRAGIPDSFPREPALDFTFDVLEYLQGSGGGTLVARAYGHKEHKAWGAPASVAEAEEVVTGKANDLFSVRQIHRTTTEGVSIRGPTLHTRRPLPAGQYRTTTTTNTPTDQTAAIRKEARESSSWSSS